MVQSRSAKAIILASGQGLTTLVGLLTVAVLARLFSKHDYATYRQTLLAYTFAAPFVMLGFNRALYYFLPTEKDRPRGVLVENLLLLGMGGLLLGLFLVAGGNELLARRFSNPGLATTLLILAPYPLLMLPAASLGACLLARERTGQVAVFNVTSRLLMLLAVVVPCLLWPIPGIAVAGLVCGALLSTTVALVLMFRACPTGDWRPTLAGLKQQFFYSIPLGLASLAGVITLSLDKVMVAALCAPASFAVYVNGAMEIPLIGIVTGSVTSVLIVDYTRLYREGRTAEILALIHRAMVKCALILLPAMVFLMCMAPEFMRVLYGPEYRASAAPFRVYLLMLPVRTITFGAILMATGNSRHVLIQSILGLIAGALLAWCGIRMFGPVGAAAGSVVALYVVSVPYLVAVVRRILKCPVHRLFPWLQLLKVGVASAVGVLGVLGAKQLLNTWPEPLLLAITAALYGVVTLVLFVVFGWLNVTAPLNRLRALLAGRS